jgi:hypothetical protein
MIPKVIRHQSKTNPPHMKLLLFSAVAVMAAGTSLTTAQTLPGAPETNGVTPKTVTAYVNGTNTINNLNTESLSIDIANNGNTIIGWEDDGDGLADIESVWTLLDPNGSLITPQTVVSNRSTVSHSTLETITTSFLSYYRSDNTSIPGYTGWGPKVKANRFGNGIGMAAMPWEIGLEVPELYDINDDDAGPPPDSNDFVCVQLLNNDGTPLRTGAINGITNLGIVTFADTDVQPVGNIRLGGWDYLSSVNILIVGESRQADDRTLTGQSADNVPVYRIVTPGGSQVKAYSAVSSTPIGGNIRNHGAAVTANGFAIRWESIGTGATVRLFDNTGTPTTTNLNLAELTGHPEASGGGNGDDHGISSNGKDAYVTSCNYNNGTNGVWVTVLNADGTVRWSKDVANDMILTGVSGTSAAIDESGQVIVVFAAKIDPTVTGSSVMGRRFNAAGQPTGGTFYVSEAEVPDLTGTLLNSSDPKVAWRNGKIAIAWLTENYPYDATLAGAPVIAYRLFVSSPLPGAPENNGLTVKTATSYVNGTNGVNNLNTEQLSVAIAKNGNVIIAWEDDGDGIEDIEAVWTMFDANGNWITSNTKIDSIAGGISVTNNYLSYFRANGSATPGYVSWGPRVHANLFGDGLGHGSNGDADLMAGEVPAYAGWLDSGNFPAVQLLDNNGAPQSEILAGVSQTYAADPASIRIADWEYLSTGNLVIVGDSRQNDDLVNLYGGTTPANHTIYRIITPAGVVVKPESLVNDTPVGSSIWYGAGATKNGFAVRFKDNERGICVRMFDNNGNPTTTNLFLSALTGYAQAGSGDRGDSTGFHGNGKDAYVHACDYNVGGFGGFWVTVLNTNGTVRWTRDVSDDMALVAGKVGRGDAAIDENGQVIVVFSSQIAGLADSVTLGRRFDASGNPLGGTFYLSEKEVPNFSTPPAAAENPRLAWRNGNVAIIWESGSYPNALIAPVVAQRYFQTSLAQPIAPSLSISGNSSSITISWTASVTGYTLESSASLTSGATWTAVPGVANNSVTVTNPTGTQFYRLKQ